MVRNYFSHCIVDKIKISRFLTLYVAKTITINFFELQGEQNCLARIVTNAPRFCHITHFYKIFALVTCSLENQIVYPDLSGSDQWTTSVHSKHASGIAKGTDTQISFWKKLIFSARLIRHKSSVVREQLTQTTSGNDLETMSQITIVFVAPLSSDHRRFRHYRSLLYNLLFI